jgi:large subunit ribosomal protein L23
VTELDRYYQIIKKPVISEKATNDAAERNAYHFRVPIGANKIEIRRAVERLFEVKVVNVNTLRVKGKWRRRGYTSGQTQTWKKALVTLAEDNRIEVL